MQDLFNLTRLRFYIKTFQYEYVGRTHTNRDTCIVVKTDISSTRHSIVETHNMMTKKLSPNERKIFLDQATDLQCPFWRWISQPEGR